MEANCIIFPSPNQYNLAAIKKKIILIPQNKTNNQHLTYLSQYCSESMIQDDEFSDYLCEVIKNAETIQNKLTTTMRTEADKNPEFERTLEGNLNTNQKVDSEEYIPCLFLKGILPKIILFFHANGEDITSAHQFLRMINIQTKYSILAMEYRGYSIYQGQTSSINIQADAQRIVQFLLQNKLTPDQIIVFGRSIGCAVGLTITHKYSIHCAILLSPFLSLKKIAKDLYGGCAQMVVKQAFNNEQNCREIRCPVLIIHGRKDTLVPYEHSLALMSGCQSYCRLKIVQNMTHTKFNFRIDFIRHFNRFIADLS